MRQRSLMYTVPIFSARILIIYFSDYKYANRILKENFFSIKLAAEDAGMGGYEDVIRDDESCARAYFIVLKNDDDDNEFRNTIIHETFHVTQDILESAGIPFKKKGMNEPYTYLNSWLQGIVEDFVCYKNK